MNKKRLINLARLVFTILLLGILFYLIEDQTIEEVTPGEAPVLYSNQSQDNLERLFVDATKNAQESILLIIYSLSDSKLIAELNRQAENGLSIHIIYDTKALSHGFLELSNKIKKQPVTLSGLMHQKILVTDHEKIWIGSANMTTESLKVHDNLVIGLMNKKFAEALRIQAPFFELSIGGQKLEYWSFPKKGREGLQRLVQLINQAHSSIRVAMFTWTHPELVEAVIAAHNRGVEVEIVLDRDQAGGVSALALEALLASNLNVRISSGIGLLHHKFAWIDEQILINGSANWTRAAFTRNWDCFIILHSLTPSQTEKMKKIWKNTHFLSQQPLINIAA